MDTTAPADQKTPPGPGRLLLKRIVSTGVAKDAGQADDGTVTFCASDGVTDRSADTVNPNGWVLDGFKANPIILFAHDDEALPVGKAVDVFVQDAKLFVKVAFTPAAVYGFGAQVGEMVKQGYLNAVSVRFAPIEYQWNGLGGIDFIKQELLEVSVVPIPCNPRALLDPTKALGAAKDFIPKEEMRAQLLAYATDCLVRELGPGVWTPMEHAKAIHGLVEDHLKAETADGASAEQGAGEAAQADAKSVPLSIEIAIPEGVDRKAVASEMAAAAERFFRAMAPAPATNPQEPEPKRLSTEELTQQATAIALGLITKKEQ